jgi:hypothetical protein
MNEEEVKKILEELNFELNTPKFLNWLYETGNIKVLKDSVENLLYLLISYKENK